MIGEANLQPPRWSNYVLVHGAEFNEFWSERLHSEAHDLLFVVFKGFDPRACLVSEAILRIGGEGRRECLAIELDEGPMSPSVAHQSDSELNWLRLQDIFSNHGPMGLQKVKTLDDRKRRTGPRIAGSFFTNLSQLKGYSDIIIDASALPKEIVFPLVGSILNIADSAFASGDSANRLNIHVCVAEDPVLDETIVEQGIDDAAFLIHGFRARIGRQAEADVPRVWVPLLGENQAIQLDRISEMVSADEICPALPSPARDPRRGDNLVSSYHTFLFDNMQVDPNNIIFVSERNPFEAYRTIRNVAEHYNEVLQPLGGCKVILSALSSKLLSLGAFLVAYELNEYVGIAHVGSEGFSMTTPDESTRDQSPPTLYNLWIEGDCYEL